MSTIEDRLRAAARAAASTVADDSAPPLRLPAPAERSRSRSRHLRLRGRSASRWPRWAAPAAAAIAVAAVVTTAAVLAQGPGRPGSAARTSNPPAAIPAGALDEVPPYFLESQSILKSDSGRTVEIAATATGKVVATATLPGPVVQIAANRSAFYAMVNIGRLAKFFEIRLLPGHHRTIVTELPIPGVPGQRTDDFAVSPDGSKLALQTYGPPRAVRKGVTEYLVQGIIVASTATGQERQWHLPAADINGSMAGMSWLADSRTLAYLWAGGRSASGMRLLDTAAPGQELLSAPLLAKISAAASNDENISADGQVLIVSDQPETQQFRGADGQLIPHGSIVSVSVRTGQARLLYTPPSVRLETGPSAGTLASGSCGNPLWMSDSGSEVLFVCDRYTPRSRHPGTVLYTLLVRDGRAYRIPWPAGMNRQSIPFVAFG